MADQATNTDTANEPQDDFDVQFDAPETGPPGTGAGTGTTVPGTGAEAEAAEPKSAMPTELAEIMRREKLPTIEGETPEAANLRLATHLHRKNAALYNQNRDLREADRRRASEIAALRQSLDPIIREHYRRERQAQLEEEVAQIPDKETDPEGYRLWLNEEVLRRLDAAERGQQEQALTAEEQEAERQVQEHLTKIDNMGYGKVAEGLGLVQGVEPDPEFTLAYDTYSEAAVTAAHSYFPEATDEQIQQFVALSQQLDIRRAEMNGVDIRDVMKGRFNALIDSLVRRGYVTRAQANAAKADAAAGAAGNGQQSQAQAPVRPAQQPQQPARTVAQTVKADAAAAARRGPSAVAATTRPNPSAGQLPDASAMEEDDFVEAALAGLLGSEEQRAAPHRKSR